MESRVEKAVELKKSMNCAQAIACAYCDLVNVPFDEMLSLTQAFGAGIGGTMQGTCGAITGAIVIIGLLNKNEPSRMKAMEEANYIMSKFREKNSATICGDIKGIDTGKVLRSCSGCVEDVARYLEDILKNHNF